MILLTFHILAGSTSLLAGYTAMFARKGGTTHRRAGIAFTVAMLAMTASGASMAALSDKLGTDISVVAGSLAFYLVGSGYLTVQPPGANSRRLLQAGLALIGAVALGAIGLGVAALASAKGRFDGVPAGMYFAFGTIAMLAAIGDARVLRNGMPTGPRRLGRHLWRMGVAMLIAAMSFFFGQAKNIPEPLRNMALLSLPVLAVFAHLLFWMVRMKWQGRVARMRPTTRIFGRAT
jgi:uncharacterized membrane protein